MTKEYMVSTEWAGYSSGEAYYKVFAETEEEAKENWWKGTETNNFTTKDSDIEHEVISVTLLEESST